ncbi:MAG: response regulator transcription factor [Acidobacteriota bacterium]|nr:response regulator transcription factor [Acidobacteriota bacterium]
MPDQEPFRIAIIEDQRHIRKGLEALISGTHGFECAGAFRSMEEALAHSWPRHPQAFLVDLGLPRMSGLDGLPHLKQRHPGVPLVVLTVFEDDDRIFRALCAGACGYLLKKTAPAKLLEALKEAIGGGAPMSPEIARRVVELFRAMRPPPSAAYNLSVQEMRLLRFLVEGHSYKTAAAEMNISVTTVAFHVQNIYQKLHVHSKSEAVAKALRHGLVSGAAPQF